MTRDSTGRLWLAQPVLDVLLAEAERRSPLETGGLLLGYAVDSDVVATHATLPGPLATHEARRYVPDAEHDAAETARVYIETSRGVDYLGDWHTHPTAAPYLSRKDRQTLRRIAQCPGARAPSPVMLIIGKTDDAHGWRFSAWRTSRRRWWGWPRMHMMHIQLDEDS